MDAYETENVEVMKIYVARYEDIDTCRIKDEKVKKMIELYGIASAHDIYSFAEVMKKIDEVDIDRLLRV